MSITAKTEVVMLWLLYSTTGSTSFASFQPCIKSWTQEHSGKTGGDNSNKRCFGTKPKLFRESGDFSGNRDTWKFFRETRDNSATMQKKSGHPGMYPQNSGGWSKFPGRLKLRPSIAQTAFVRVVTPRGKGSFRWNISSERHFQIVKKKSSVFFS